MAAPESVDESEIARFARDSHRWWDENGPFRPLHRLNPVRIGYIRKQAERRFGLDAKSLQPFTGLKIADIGCGGGLACEPLARLGATVTGIDADRQAIAVASGHARQAGLSIDYRAASVEEIKRESFDIVLALEIVEHVAERPGFIGHCARLCKPGGLVVFSTLNRTGRSFALGIVAAEYVLGWVPRGTHDWRKFIRPSELAELAAGSGLNPVDATGLVFNPLRNAFELSRRDLAVNYFLTTEKNS